jgi:hypothetical protein
MTALVRFNSWIEPAIIAEWTRYISQYAENQGRRLTETDLRSALRWSDPERDVALARECALKLLGMGELKCVWTGKPLRQSTFDADHCFPWSALPCDRLWNLMPTHREVNQREKRHRLPSADHLRDSQDRITSWWEKGYQLERNEALTERFFTEAQAAPPSLENRAMLNVRDVFRDSNSSVSASIMINRSRNGNEHRPWRTFMDNKLCFTHRPQLLNPLCR